MRQLSPGFRWGQKIVFSRSIQYQKNAVEVLQYPT
jgi:hypothetical protein